LLQSCAVERVEPRVGARRDGAPRLPRLVERRGAGRRAAPEPLVDLRVRELPLGEVEEVPLLLPRQVSEAPAQAVEGKDVPNGLLGIEAPWAPRELAARDPERLHLWVRHGELLLRARPSQ